MLVSHQILMLLISFVSRLIDWINPWGPKWTCWLARRGFRIIRDVTVDGMKRFPLYEMTKIDQQGNMFVILTHGCWRPNQPLKKELIGACIVGGCKDVDVCEHMNIRSSSFSPRNDDAPCAGDYVRLVMSQRKHRHCSKIGDRLVIKIITSNLDEFQFSGSDRISW